MALLGRFHSWLHGSTAAAPVAIAPATAAQPAMPLEIRASVVTDQGRARTENQDSVVFTRPSDAETLASRGVMALVADARGGCNGASLASWRACQAIPKSYLASAEPLPQALRSAVEAANREIYQAAQGQPDLAGMGTTCVAFVVAGGGGWLAYVGDSRLYLIRGGRIYRMSEDHSVVFEMVHQGLLTPEQARNHEDRNVLSRALGSKPQVDVTFWDGPLPIHADDRFLLCSDGLHDLVSDDEMLAMAGAGDIGEASRRLVDSANERGGYDNISVILLEAGSAADAAPRRAPNATREVQLP